MSNRTNIKQNILNRAVIEAAKSEFKQRVGCVIFKGNTIVATGYNIVRHCRHLPMKYKRWLNSLHAEQKAIIFTNQNIKRCSILVIRLGARDQLLLAKPCMLCQGLIYDSGIRKIYYSNRLGEIEEMVE